jgi:hypothetical protein
VAPLGVLILALVSAGEISGRQSGGGREMLKQITHVNTVDENVGMQIQRRRKFLGISESFLTEALGLTLIEYRKCEIGERRVGAEGLLKLAGLLGVSPAFFFEGDPGEAGLPSSWGDSTLQ